MSDIIVTNVTENKHCDCDSVTAWLTSSPQLSLIKNRAWVYFVTKPEPWASSQGGSEILFYMQTGTINCINWTFNFSQQYLGKVLVQYIHPSDIARLLYLLWWQHGLGIRCRPGSGKLVLIMRRRTRALFMGHMIQLLLHDQLSPLHWARHHTAQLQLYRASAIQADHSEHHCSSLSIVIPGNRNGLISDSDLNVLRFPHRQDGSGPAWSLDESVISGVERGPLYGSFCV